MNIAIIDDSSKDCTQLVKMIKNYARESMISVWITEYRSGEEFLEEASLTIFDVVFLGIYVGQLSGMDVAFVVREKHSACQIVFVTMSEAYALKSDEICAFYYVLKPITYEVISNVIELLDKSLTKSSRYIKVKESSEWHKILLCDILYVDYDNHYVQIHSTDAIISTYMKFSEIKEKLLKYSEFIVCYRCIIVNMSKIVKVVDVYFLINSGEYLPISRKQIKDIKSLFADYMFDRIDHGG